ncbi:MAG TPA: DUF222 domain-containing protein, partial [Aeromicrobium sp.]|nr:DUF222 domain-containing protein [Aeromicrobium sp.]
TATRERARAEAAEWASMLAYFESRESEIQARANPRLFERQAELSTIALDIGRATGHSEAQVCHRVAAARRLRDKTPAVWSAFAQGRVDAARVREIAGAVDKLERPSSVARLDRRFVAYAESHTVAELRRWLKLFVARVESDLFNQRAERERADRSVDVQHGDDGMSWLTLYNTSFAIAAIDKRLTKEAKAMGADDPRTLQQRGADLLAAWATTNEAGEAAVNADIAVTIPASTLVGADDLPAVAADGAWVAPAAWILDLAKDARDNVFWHRMLLDPVTDDVLSHEYKGRFVPRVLSKALEFRDGVCQAPGCCRPASLCDVDHRVPHEADGPTAGWNLGPYCRRHHKLKGFGLIDIGPTTQGPPGRSRNLTMHSIGMPEFSRPEMHLQRILLEYAEPA